MPLFNYNLFSVVSSPMSAKMERILRNFIVFEGIDGSGKTTQAKLFSKHLTESGKKVHETFEPTDKEIGTLVRKALKKEFRTTPLALAYLYAADREDHLGNPEYGMEKHIEDGEIVVSDRYFFSSFAYQGVEVDKSKVKELNDFPYPMAVVYVDASAKLAMKRIEERGNGKELFERLDFLEKVRDGFEEAFKDLPEGVKLVRVDASLSKEEIADKVYGELKSLI